MPSQTRSPSSARQDTSLPASGGGQGWTNIDAAWASDNAYAQCAYSILNFNGWQSNYLIQEGFGFSVPTGSTIDGIEVRVERRRGGSGDVVDASVRLVQAGTITGNDKAKTSDIWQTTDTLIYYAGSSTDLWGATWTAAQINASGFGVAFAANETAENYTAIAQVDHIQVIVYYTSPPTPTNVNPATITGTATVGQTLTLTDGSGAEDWTGEDTIATQWQRADNSAFTTNLQDITGATSGTYLLATADAAKYVRCRVRATNTTGSTDSNSNIVGPVTSPPAPPVNVTSPTIAGSPAQVGVTLTLTDGAGVEDWTGEDTIALQWQRADNLAFTTNVTAITGATNSAYLLAVADAAKYVRCRVRATNAQGSTDAYSNIIGPVTNPPIPVQSIAPVASIVGGGPVVAGALATVTTGSWDNSPLSYGYQWQRRLGGGAVTDIPGATSSTYGITSGDVGYELRCHVSATNASGTG